MPLVLGLIIILVSMQQHFSLSRVTSLIYRTIPAFSVIMDRVHRILTKNYRFLINATL